MATLLITGCNRGIGLELACQYLQDGWRVHGCCRNPSQADELQQLQEQHAENLQIHALDVASERGIAELKSALEDQPIDLLLNNAGVYGGAGNRLGSLDTEEWLQVLRVNTIAPLLMAQTFLDNVAASKGKTIASVSSKVGSIADNRGGSNYMYRSSKTALNQAMKSLSIDTAHLGLKTVVLHPGWVQTDMGGPNALITVAESASGLKKVLDELTPEQSGQFINYDGSEIPW
ncbi:SDR family oxidoreductase [Porticoccus sp. W117]|uniref:SDR family oxidoreductase n=1 Tax=Porticoccus sp. W117 TaxID=3054777 RepID=UPI0025915C64|nr:SDR family oxidoreductase [Porticoccus sp. W117]MDM3872492.1 SDR family oxidoreductase [Porticoccus sp. W117]